MRILVISQYFAPEDFRINDVVAGLVEQGHQLTVLTGLPNYPKGKLAPGYSWSGPYSEEWSGAKVVRVPLVTRGEGKGLRLILNYLSFVFFATVLGMVRCREKYDVILVCQLSPVTVGIPARFLGWFRGAPILFWVQDLWPESLSATGAVSSPKVLSFIRLLVRWIYKGCARVLIQSRAFEEPIHAMGVNRENILFFPNGAEPFYQPIDRTTDLEFPALPKGFRVMFAGNIGKAQSFETILASAERLRDHKQIKWIVLGDGREAKWVKQQIESRGLQESVYLMGRHPVADMPRWFSQADVMLASLTNDPIFAMTIPAKIQSYLACAKPIIASINGEGARIVEESGAGYAVPSQDASALAEAVIKMSQLSQRELKALGTQGRRYFEENFGREYLLDRLEGWCEDVARGDR